MGSPAGLTYFNEYSVSNVSICRIKLLNINVSGKNYRLDSLHLLSHKDNNISFEYVAISFKSGGDIIYHYKLKGLDNQWRETRQTNIDYQALPPGDYELELFASNMFNVNSEKINIQFSISNPFWNTWWFYSLIFLLGIFLTWWVVNRKNEKSRRLLLTQNKIQQQFAELEQQALQAQMNPHFIFNCLNSIQQFILTNEKEKANQYLTGFASLVRQTLDNSGRKSITIAEEISYLSSFLEMEKMRYGDNFKYTIIADLSVETDYTEIPAMLLQPYVENCLRHGIRYLEFGFGEVKISFSQAENMLFCSIKDNGVGREKAEKLKSNQHITYHSKGISLTGKRIELLNKVNNNEITVQIKDLVDEEGNSTGTEVILNIPL